MATRLTRSLDYAVTPAALHRALLTESYWHARVAEVGGEGARIESLQLGDGGVRVHVVHEIGADKLPPVVTAIRPGPMHIQRVEQWGPFNGSGCDGSFTADIDGAPAKMSGTTRLTPEGDGARITADGSATVSIPFVASKVENLVIENLQELMERERDFTVDWVAANPA
jgi:hypothetical protein